ncbi:unnamed protein product [Caretta caretta]
MGGGEVGFSMKLRKLLRKNIDGNKNVSISSNNACGIDPASPPALGKGFWKRALGEAICTVPSPHWCCHFLAFMSSKTKFKRQKIMRNKSRNQNVKRNLWISCSLIKSFEVRR